MRVFSVRSCDSLDVWGPFCFFILGHLRDINTVESCHIKAVVEFFSFSGHCWATVIYFKCNYAKHKKKQKPLTHAQRWNLSIIISNGYKFIYFHYEK